MTERGNEGRRKRRGYETGLVVEEGVGGSSRKEAFLPDQGVEVSKLREKVLIERRKSRKALTIEKQKESKGGAVPGENEVLKGIG